jgi:hypothetical protein
VQVRGRNNGGGVGILLPAAIILGVGWLVLCWPALAWHGYTDTGGWRWDVHSTIACAVWWGIIAAAVVFWVCSKIPVKPAPKAQPDRWWEGPEYQRAALKQAAKRPAAEPLLPRPPDTPICLHLGAEPVHTLPTALRGPEVVAWWCQQCETQLPADFGETRRSCCGTPLGEDHLYNCQYK